MEFRLEINMDNAAFDDAGEVPRILRELAKKVRATPEVGSWSVFDINGNRVGQAEYIGSKVGA
jgi:hypothetical protein